MLLIKLLAVYSIAVVALVSVIILGFATDVRQQAIIKEMLGASCSGSSSGDR